MEDEFYITLVSNLKTEEFKNNSQSYFVTPLPTPLQLNIDEWGVGLAEIIIPDTWFNITKNESKITIENRGIPRTISLTPGYYTMKQFLKELRSKIEGSRPTTITTSECTIVFDTESNRLIININKHIKLLITKYLSEKLGYTKTLLEEGKNITTEPCDLNSNCHIIFVYSNIVSETILGNSYHKLLRTITTPISIANATQEINYTTITFDRPHYKKVSSSFENKIDIALVNSKAEPFFFQSGEVHVTLHFKRMIKK